MIDFSCADEVVAKLLLRYADAEPPQRRVLPVSRRDATITATRSRRCSSATGSRWSLETDDGAARRRASSTTASGARGRASRELGRADAGRSGQRAGRRGDRSASALLDTPAPPAPHHAHRRRLRRRRGSASGMTEDRRNPPLRVARFIGTRTSDERARAAGAHAMPTRRGRVCSWTASWRGCTARAGTSSRRCVIDDRDAARRRGPARHRGRGAVGDRSRREARSRPATPPRAPSPDAATRSPCLDATHARPSRFRRSPFTPASRRTMRTRPSCTPLVPVGQLHPGDRDRRGAALPALRQHAERRGRAAAARGARGRRGRAACSSSGMGATACALLALLRPGDHLLASAWIYGGTRALLDAGVRVARHRGHARRSDSRRAAGGKRHAQGDARDLPGVAGEPDVPGDRPRGRSAISRRRAGSRWSSTPRSRARSTSGRWSTAPTSSSTRPPST